MAYSDEASQKQIDLIKRLFPALAEKMDAASGSTEAEQVTASVGKVQDVLLKVMAGHPATKGEVSPAIDVLFAADRLLTKAAARVTTPGIVNADRIIANKFGKPCEHCQDDVEANAGYAAQIAGRWVTVCAQCASEAPEVRQERLAARPAPEVPQPTKIVEGELWTVDGGIYRIHCSLAGRLYTKRLTDSGKSFAYDASGMAKVRKSGTKLTLEEAKEFGRMTGQCCVCARTLTDPVSISEGIGPICKGKF